MSTECNSRYNEYRETLAQLVRETKSPYSNELLLAMTPHWDEDYRYRVSKKLWRGPVIEDIPPTLVSGSHSVSISPMEIRYLGFEKNRNSAEVTNANAYALKNWPEAMLDKRPAEVIQCAIINPQLGRLRPDSHLSVAIVLNLPLAEIQDNPHEENTTLRARLANHIVSYTTCEAGILELQVISGTNRTNPIDICCGCGSDFDYCRCWLKANAAARSTLFALPRDMMEKLSPQVLEKSAQYADCLS